MNAIPLIRVGPVLTFIRFLDQIGCPTDRILKQSNLPNFGLAEPEALIPVYQTFDFCERAARLEHDESLGLAIAQASQIDDLGMFGQFIQQSLTVWDLIKAIERMIPLLNTIERTWLVEKGDRVWLHHTYQCPETVACLQARLYALSLYIKAIRLATGNDWKPLEIHLRARYSQRLETADGFAGVPIRFNQPTDAIVIPKALLSTPLRRKRLPSSLSLQECSRQLQQTAPSRDFAGSLQQLLTILLQDGYPAINLAAEAAGVSVRSFQRRLAEANLSYSRLVEQVRFDQAIHMLSDSNYQLIDIANELGYTDAANFTRAFKRWTGVSPRQFRRLHASAPQQYQSLSISSKTG